MKNMKIKIFIFCIFSSLSWNALNAQCEFFQDYNGIIATIAPNSVVGQSFQMNCNNGDNAFESITINHQAPVFVNATLRIYAGENYTGVPQYEQNISIAPQGSNVHETIVLQGGTVSLMFQEGEMYTLTFVFSNIFRWNGRNSNLAPARALWPNNGGTWVTHFDYFYRVGTQLIVTDSDGDGVDDPADACPDTPAGEGVNADGCSCSQVTVDDGDACTLDVCLDGIVTNTFQDADGDGVCDAYDVCPGGDDNADNDLDGTPDYCDEDDDNDGIVDDCDTAPFVDNFTFNGIGPDFPQDWLCGKKNNKVKICKVPSGNSSNAHTICVSENAVATHLNNPNNYLGDCTCTNQNLSTPGNIGFNSTTAVSNFSLELVPNPASNEVNIHIQAMEEVATLNVFDQLGRIIWTQELEEQQNLIQLNLNQKIFQNGSYIVSIQTTSGERITKRLLIAK
jgi:hypothetical protein